ncbi:endonuclease/exonuclease/phosphatase family protein [Hujiaoplasma nucleasis]|uniref:Endonuclease/exonuclease/phosphatase family protein n=1 Tax=Hujiaoplasma nucleasis TaxID=2725268 RepID=A0A7L6N2G8_9MOLU|nr:endonuclease/exonuclease/phosphatase family protein [Hujiaoplasma nucleasis]QLY39418.1 endonuclease/exonuclease/phosphatase family protein [Hujiaoplasma nucleasis]
MKRKIKYMLIGTTLSIVLLAIFAFTIVNVKDVPDKGSNIRVVSYNIKNAASNLETFEQRKDVIINQVLDYNPDVIGFQEADYGWMSEFSGLPGLLDDYGFVGVGREDGDTQGEFAPIFYLSDKYIVIDSGTFWLSETPKEVSIGWDASTYRIVTWVTLEDIESGNQFTHYNTHFDHIGKTSQLESAKLLVNVVEECETPFVITGDFNVLQGSKTYDIIVKSDRVHDSKKIAKDSMIHGTVNWFQPINVWLMPPIDFIFVSSQIIVETYRVDNSFWFDDLPVSDHYPVIVDINLSTK